MRWLFIFLVIFNGIVYWWYSHQVDSFSVKVDQGTKKEILVSETTPALLLLSEMPEKERSVVSGPVSTQEQHPIYEDKFSDVVGLPVEAPSVTADVEIESIELVGEGALLREVADKAVDPMCGYLGPFNDVVTAKQLSYRLSTVEISGDLYKEAVPGEKIYWVYLNPQSSRSRSLALLRKLQASKIDSFVITEGELKNGLSLGFFKHRKSAVRVQNDRIKDGYDARLKEKQKTRDEFWVVVQPAQLAKLSEPLLSELSKDFEIFQNKINLCEQVASMINIE